MVLCVTVFIVGVLVLLNLREIAMLGVLACSIFWLKTVYSALLLVGFDPTISQFIVLVAGLAGTCGIAVTLDSRRYENVIPIQLKRSDLAEKDVDWH